MSTKEVELLKSVAVAAKALVQSASGASLYAHEETVDEAALTTLETALAAAGYDMTDEEFEQQCSTLQRKADAT